MLEQVNSPSDVKQLSITERKTLAEDIRTFLIETIAKTGGHLGSNLGIVELSIALHYHFDSPKDKLLFDVGHQAYVHKILTGRKDRFDTLRQYHGLSGFLKMNESEHDVWEAGHSSTSISAACGFAMSRDIAGDDNHVVAIIGDGSMTNGMSLEALNHLVELQSKAIIILNDNEMSISSNVGFIDAILKNLETSEHYKQTKTKVRSGLSHTRLGKIIAELISVSKRRFKQEIQSDAKTFFSVLGFDYIGAVDGHDFKKLDEAIEKAKASDNSVILHVKTTKGKGYAPAMTYKWHGVGPFDVSTGELNDNSESLNHSKFVSELVIDHMKVDDDIVVITPAMLDGSELNKINELFPNRVTDVGIAEEHGVTLAAALALAGRKPFMSIYSTFLQRGYDQVFHDIVRQNADVVIGIDRAGLVGADGETHQGIYDISFLSHMHNLIICQGRTSSEIAGLLKFAFDYKGPVAFRYPRGGKFTEDDVKVTPEPVTLGTWKKLQTSEQSKLAIFAYGPILDNIEAAVSALNVEIDIINCLFIKPLDTKLLDGYQDHKILVVEEHTNNGSMQSAIVEYFNVKGTPKQIHTINLGDRFVEQGSIDSLYKEAGLDTDSIKQTIEKLI
ncbi:1-deoxy-D-xylulose-5-phosphate synthase [Mollicutes bacterium LVI A0039]|nr:1-deoxy-D-xylulose-5-phosphate synthase [Mollicutes bacterium LVI A0039]